MSPIKTRVPVSNIRPVLHCNTKKTPRVIAVGEDSSVRLLSVESGQSVSTILPPPDISPLNKVKKCTPDFLLETFKIVINKIIF